LDLGADVACKYLKETSYQIVEVNKVRKVA
jgi:hypothetical protein